VSLSTPDVLVRLMTAPDARGRESAWAGFLEQYSGLILHVARSRSRDHDAIMSCYEFVVDQLVATIMHGCVDMWPMDMASSQRGSSLWCDVCASTTTGSATVAFKRPTATGIWSAALTDLVGDVVGLELLAILTLPTTWC
jgi:hypothetical protein